MQSRWHGPTSIFSAYHDPERIILPPKSGWRGKAAPELLRGKLVAESASTGIGLLDFPDDHPRRACIPASRSTCRSRSEIFDGRTSPADTGAGLDGGAVCCSPSPGFGALVVLRALTLRPSWWFQPADIALCRTCSSPWDSLPKFPHGHAVLNVATPRFFWRWAFLVTARCLASTAPPKAYRQQPGPCAKRRPRVGWRAQSTKKQSAAAIQCAPARAGELFCAEHASSKEKKSRRFARASRARFWRTSTIAHAGPRSRLLFPSSATFIGQGPRREPIHGAVRSRS